MIHKRMVGDTLTPLNAKLSRNGNPVDLSALTLKFQIEKDDGTAMLAETTTGCTAHPTVTFTAATTDWITANAHGLERYDQIVLSNSGGALPAGLSTATRYFVRDVSPNRFKVELAPDTEVVDITGTGTGTHSYYVVGCCQYTFASATVASAYTGRGWFTTFSGSDRDTLPTDGAGIRIEVVAYGN